MKKLYLLLLILGLSLPLMAQQPVGFFQPVPKNLFQVSGDRARANQSIWLLRPTIEITAMQLTWNKEQKNFDISSLQSAGPGISYAHYISVNDEPYNNFSVNALLLFGLKPGETIQTTISTAVTLSAFEFVNLGVGRNFTTNKNFILTGVTLKF